MFNKRDDPKNTRDGYYGIEDLCSGPDHGPTLASRKNAEDVRDFYNEKAQRRGRPRDRSRIIQLRRFNNWIKAVLIEENVQRSPNGDSSSILDIGCGQGGDLQKWRSARTSQYVGIDIAAQAIHDARRRSQSMRLSGLRTRFLVADCYGASISPALIAANLPLTYDNVSMQFSLHYAFDNAKKVDTMLKNVTRHLRSGGVFVGTIPDSSALGEARARLPPGQKDFGNALFRVEFDNPSSQQTYGQAYHFVLHEAVDAKEYVVVWESFVRLAAAHGLRLRSRRSFRAILQDDEDGRHAGLLLAMGVATDNGEVCIEKDQWEIIDLYHAFVFERQ